MTAAKPTPRDKDTHPPETSSRSRRGRAAARRTAARQAKPAQLAGPASAMPRGKGAKRGKAAGRRAKVAAAKARKAAKPKAATPAKVRILQAGPRRVKAPAPLVWDVLPVPATPIEAPAPASPPPPVLADRPRRTVGKVLLVGAVVLALAAVGLATQVTSAPNTGTIKVHDGPTADPDTRNEPHVSGDLYVEGFNMDADSGDLFFFSWPPTGNGELVLEATWAADDGEPSFHFLEGPFFLPCGHYRVGASNGPADPEDFPGGMKKKTFWVECEEEPEPEPTTSTGPSPTPEPEPTTSTGPSPGPTTSTGPSPTPEPEPEPEPELACPGFSATAREDGSIEIAWTAATGADGTNIYRAAGDGDFEYVTTVTGDVGIYVDTTTEPGTGYAYYLTALFGNEESEGCGVVETTAIPEFPTSLGLSLATVGGVVALALAGRRKA